VLAPLDRAVLRRRAQDGTLPPLFDGLVPARVRRAGSGGSALAERLRGLGQDQRFRVLLDLVRSHVATTLGHDSAGSVAPDQAFKELGFDSLTAVELRNQLSAGTGLSLPATLVFDFPTPTALAKYLDGRVADGHSAGRPVIAELEALEAAVSATTLDDPGRNLLHARLQSLLWRLAEAQEPAEDLASVTDDELFDVLDNELGLLGGDGR
jgi:acyl carrier protein